MNGHERISAALEGNKADKVPVMLHNFLMASKEAGYSQAEYRESPAAIAETFIQAVETYGYDGIVVDIDTATLAGAVGVPVDYPEHECARTTGGLLADIRDADKLRKRDIGSFKYVDIWLEATRLLKDHFRGEIFVRGNCDQAPFSLACLIRGTQDFMMDLVDEDAWPHIAGLLEYSEAACASFVGLMAQAGADGLSNGDSLAGPSMVSPETYRRFALPYERRVAARAKGLGIPYILHVCGNTDLILKDLAATGADGIELDYLTDTELVKREFGKSVTFIGNIDPSGVLALGSAASVEAATAALLDDFAGEPRFILNAGCAIPSTTPAENLRVLVATARSYR